MINARKSALKDEGHCSMQFYTVTLNYAIMENNIVQSWKITLCNHEGGWGAVILNYAIMKR